MSQNRKKDFNPVTKIYDSSDYNKQDEVSKGLATTHEQFSDSYMVGDILTHDPENQDREGNKK
ncbi:YozQ family protein [Niallia sp. XMNu-256]|uniref:YozQ family protein n=1 Tax=Niallia sp. XMNu-256 TaxID=3082444 RepID=UPI0030D005A2